MLSINGLYCAYGGVQAVNGVDLEVRTGQFMGVIGPNGAGKSTLIDCVSGRNRSYKGTVDFDGRNIAGKSASAIAKLGFCRTFQTPRLFPRSSVLTNLMIAPMAQTGERMFSSLVGSWKDQERRLLVRAWDMLRRFELENVADNYASELSGGQERLVELARVLLTDPKLLILDEPFAGVSPKNRVKLGEILRGLVGTGGMTVVMVEHRLEWIQELCDEVTAMANGVVIAKGPMESMRGNRTVVDAYLGQAVGQR